MEMIVLSMFIFWSFIAIFGICEYGERLRETFNEISDAYNQLAFYLYPCDVQHMLTTLLMVAQKPVELEVFGSIVCGRITFKNVFNRALSCFMVLRRFGN